MTAVPNARMFPPGDGKHPAITLNGRVYTASTGGYFDVPDFDAQMLQANGWSRAGGNGCYVGATSARPTLAPGGQPVANGQTFIDTTLTAVVMWDALAKSWRNVLTGAVA